MVDKNIYRPQKRTKEENSQFYELIEVAVDKLEQAVSEISYSAFPEMNQDVIKEIKETAEKLAILNEEIEYGEIILMKPAKKEEK